MKKPASYSQDEWRLRQLFVDHIDSICAEEDISISWLSDAWVGRLQKGSIVHFIYGQHFSLNNAAATAIANDKVATYEVLNHANIPAVAHKMIRFIDGKPHLPLGNTFPCVVKPCAKGNGHDVHKLHNSADLTSVATSMLKRYGQIAIVPFFDIIDEYRVVVFDNKVSFMFKKIREKGEWRHNLSLGGKAEPVNDPRLEERLEALAIQASRALDIRLASVDIITSKQGLFVLEVNSGFTLNRVGERFASSTRELYKRAIMAVFTPKNHK